MRPSSHHWAATSTGLAERGGQRRPGTAGLLVWQGVVSLPLTGHLSGCDQQGLQKEESGSWPGPEEEVAESKEVAHSEEPTAAGLSVTVTHSNERHDPRVTPQQGCNEPTVEDVAQVVEEATGVLLPFQKLTFKGKSL